VLHFPHHDSIEGAIWRSCNDDDISCRNLADEQSVLTDWTLGDRRGD
jgi:hypothetical protein